MKKIILKIIPWLLPIIFLIIWQSLSSFKLLDGVYLRNISSPYLVIKSAITLIQEEDLSQHILISTKRAIIGFLTGGSIGFILGLITGTSNICRLFLEKSIEMLRNIPHLALIPLVILWFGIGEMAKIFLVALGTFFPIYLNTYYGIKGIDNNLIEMARSYGLKRFSYLKDIIIPGALPSIFVGIRFSLGIMWLTLIVSETIAASSGIGYLSMQAREFFRSDIIIFTIILYALLGVLADIIAKLLEKTFLKWDENYLKSIK